MAVIISPTSNYAKLHNDYLYQLEIDGKRYKSATHFIYSAMMPDYKMAEAIKFQLDGATVRKIANGFLFGKKAKGDRKLSNAAELTILKALGEAYRARFAKKKYRDLLIGTNHEPIIYTPRDVTFLPGDITVLGLNQADNGQNLLGLLLGTIREEFRVFTSVPVQEIHAVDRLFFVIKRRELLLSVLNKGHFPVDYSLGKLYGDTKGIYGDISGPFLVDYPSDVRLNYWRLYEKGRAERQMLLDPVIIEEFETGNTDWIEEAYEYFAEQLAVLKVYLEHTHTDFNQLRISIAKKQIIEGYWGRRFDFTGGKATQLTMAQYLQKYQITRETIDFIGDEALADLRTTIYKRYKKGELDAIQNLTQLIKQEMDNQLFIIHQHTKFVKFTPIVEEPSKEFLRLVTTDPNIREPASPRYTFGGEDLDVYYPPILPAGACNEDINSVCPLGGDDDEDDGEQEQEFEDDQDDDAKRAERENEGYDEKDAEEHGDEANEFIGEDQDFVGEAMAIKDDPKVPIKRYQLPSNPIRFASERDYPYEWMSPYFIEMLNINGLWYPSVAHYVIAKLATPIQFRNISPRLWIQKKPSYIFPEKNLSAPDKLNKPGDFWSIAECVELLPKRIQDIYNDLFVRYADKVLRLKMRHYPFRPLLFSTRPHKITYYDDEVAHTAVAGTQLATILTEIRNDIRDIDTLTIIPAPVYNKKENTELYNFVRDRTTELLRAIVLVARYRLAPRTGYLTPIIPTIHSEDARFVLTHLYSACEDINYNETTEDPPQHYLDEFTTIFEELIQKYFSGRSMKDLNEPDNIDAIRLKNEGKSEDPMNDKIFVSTSDIQQMIWVHVCYIVQYLEKGLIGPEDKTYTQAQLKSKIKDARASIYALPGLGEKTTKAATAVAACTNIIGALHLLFSKQTSISQSEIDFVNSFIYPIAVEVKTPRESEYYNAVLSNNITEIFNGHEQDLSTLKKLAWIIENIINFPSDSTILSTKLTIRIKFFAFA